MNRLTKQYADTKRYYSTHTCDEVVQRLGKLEDLEEDLGCSLETIIEATTNGIIDWEGKEHCVVFQENCLLVIENDELQYALALKNYRKSWWLKGEKEND